MSRESDLAKASFTSAIDFEGAKTLIKFPDEVRGLTVVDIGAGASNVTKKLREKGANAYALDFRYDKPKELELSLAKYLRFNVHNTVQSLSVSEEAKKADTEYLQRSAVAAEEFWQDFRRNRERYRTGLASRLPFHTHSVDLCFSIQSVSRFLIADMEVFARAVNEMLRVLKPASASYPGGEIQLFPWPTNLDYSELELMNAEGFLRYLREENFQHRLEPVSGGSPRLVIVNA